MSKLASGQLCIQATNKSAIKRRRIFSMHRVADSGTEFRLTTVLSLVSEFILDLDELFDVTSCGLWLVKLTAGVLFLFNVKRDMVASGTM